MTIDLVAMEYVVRDGVATATMNTPDNYNAMTAQMSADLATVLQEANDDAEVRVFVLTGTGKAFCAGGETKSDLPSMSRDPYFLTRRSPRAGGSRSFVQQLRGFEKPTIAALNGVAAGGGFSLALACDIRMASDRARLSQVFVRRGLVPDTGSSYLLPRLVGIAKALELTFTGDILDAQTALQIGLVNHVVPHEELMDATNALAAKIASGPPIAMRLAKRIMYHGAESDLDAAYEFEAYLQGICLQTEDFREGLAAFAERREPRFTGR
jgi:2-(1,2-epoxy-1,2-dihydrophenyl)acetyl-CoA isomerase